MLDARKTDIYEQVTGQDFNWDMVGPREHLTKEHLDHEITERTLDGQLLVPEDFNPEFSIIFWRRNPIQAGGQQFIEVYVGGDEAIVADWHPDVNDEDKFGFRCKRDKVADALGALEYVWKASFEKPFNEDTMAEGMKKLRALGDGQVVRE